MESFPESSMVGIVPEVSVGVYGLKPKGTQPAVSFP